MALRCVLEKVCRIGYNNYLKTKIGALSGISVKNHPNLSPFCRHSSSRWYKQPSCTSFSDSIDHTPTEVKDLSCQPPESEINDEFDVDFEIDRDVCGGIIPALGPLDHPQLTEAARIAVELHNKKQNSNLEFVRVIKANTQGVGGVFWFITFEATDAGVKNTYQAKLFWSIKNEWRLELFRLAPPSSSNLVAEGDWDKHVEAWDKQVEATLKKMFRHPELK